MSISTHFSPDVGTVPGLEIWRIENFAPVQYKKQLYGTFYSGDAYLVLCTIQKGSKLKWDVHFWLGENASQDEIGTAALLAVELDNHLGGVPVQHREVQGHESSLFSSYFSAGIRYLDGGVASGFRKVSDEQYEKKLLQIKGKRNVRVVQVPLHVSSMNKGDCFVLDTEKTIYVYVGQGSKRTERLKAIQAANQVRDQDHAGKAQIFILDEYADVKQFSIYFEELGSGSPSEVPEAKEDDDAAFEESQSKAPALFHVSDASGALVVRKIGEKPLQQTMLDKKDCFILDTAGSGLFVWVGSQCTSNEKSQAMIIAEKYLKENGYPKWTRVHRVVDGGEPTIFRQYFASWKDKDEAGLPIPLPVSTLKRDQLGEFDVKSLHREKLRLLLKQGGAAPGFYPDDGSGQKEIYRVENFELKAIHESAYGMFFGGDSYVIKYTYDGGRRYIVYFWQGNESSHDEKAASAIHAANMDNNQLGGMAVQVRVTQGNEPRHFIKMFQGRMIIFSGGRASGFRNVHDYDSYDVDGTRLFHVCGSAIDDMRAVQVPEKASFLNSNDVFVLETPSKTFIWYGSASSQEEKDLGIEVSNMVSPDHATETIAEGEEPEEFWNALGGKEPYTTEPPEVAPALKTRLFHCTLSSLGRLRVEEIKSFKQEDLVEDDIMVLDSGIEIYVWVGRLATDAEREAGWRMAQEYLRTEPSPRTADSSIIVLVPQGKEPDSFKIAFPNWDDDMWKL